MKYSESFRTLEAISDAIHISRNNKIWSMFPRMPGVGSDTFSVSSGLSDLGLGINFLAYNKNFGHFSAKMVRQLSIHITC